MRVKEEGELKRKKKKPKNQQKFWDIEERDVC